LFYAFLTTPVLYALRSTAETNAISLAGVLLAWIGISLEAIADFHKLIVSQSKDDVVKEFVGPTTWTYRICRHPNYFGKVLFWIGLFFGGVTSFGASIPAWAGSTLGLLGISAVMVKSTEGLEKRQREKYAGQESFDMWRKQVKYALIPGFQ
jgi:steroid 5-alpha reductase family enzyme